MPSQASQVLGFIGYVEFVLNNAFRVRATSCDIKATQNIEPGNVVDGHIDKTTYSLMPIEVGGSIAFPAVWEDGSTVTTKLWQSCLQRTATGNFQNPISAINVKYADQAAYSYVNDFVDTFEFNATQSETVNINIGIFGTTRANGFTMSTEQPPSTFFVNKNSRLVTWNDAAIYFTNNVGFSLTTSEIRSFKCTVNNNSQRFYSLNGLLTPQIIAPTKRDITGTMSIMGRNQSLAYYAYNNQTRCTEPGEVQFGYAVGIGTTGSDCNGDFMVKIPGAIYNIEEIAITNELLETTVAYRCLPGIAYEKNLTDFLV
jgi:hypothetical protein